jgi:hypothetical protein
MRKFVLAGLAFLGLGLWLPPQAWAPPAEGVPNVGVSPRCAVYGHEIAVHGYGFAAGSEVLVSAPVGHYEGPPLPVRFIQSQTVTADDAGAIEATLQVPHGDGTRYWRYQPRAIFAEGPDGLDGEPGSSFDELVIGTRKVCRKLS